MAYLRLVRAAGGAAPLRYHLQLRRRGDFPDRDRFLEPFEMHLAKGLKRVVLSRGKLSDRIRENDVIALTDVGDPARLHYD